MADPAGARVGSSEALLADHEVGIVGQLAAADLAW